MTRYRFAAELPEELGRELKELAAEVRAAERPSRLASRGADLVLRVTQANLDYYFVRSARRLEVGMVSESAVKLGLRTAMGAPRFASGSTRPVVHVEMNSAHG